MKKGFTIIELVVVFSVMAIISTVGIASFSTYSNSQKLQSTTLGIKSLLTEARSKSLSQDIQSSCASGSFQGYQMDLCHDNGSSPPTCGSGNYYELGIVCGGTYTSISGTKQAIPTGISVDTANTTNPSVFLFIPITGGVTPSGKIVLKEETNNAEQTITITSSGIIQ